MNSKIREELPSGIRVEELSNISRKLDTGNESLKEIKGTLNKNTALLGSMDASLPERIAQALKTPWRRRDDSLSDLFLAFVTFSNTHRF